MPGRAVPVDPALQELADAYGVATSYDDQTHHRIQVGPETVTAVLAAMGVDAASPVAINEALAARRNSEQLLPATVVVRQGTTRDLRVQAPLVVELEEGGTRRVDGSRLPADLALGWHTLVVGSGSGEQRATLIVAPPRLPLPARTHGWAVQLYAARSTSSWGIGDLADLRTLAEWSAAHGAGLLVCNPLHAVSPTTAQQPSPYFPGSRMFVNPLYLRIEETAAYRSAGRQLRADVDAAGAIERRTNTDDRIDRDGVWRAKTAALEALWRAGDHAASEPTGRLRDFATWCALAETHGADWRAWPEELRRPDGGAVEAARRDRRVGARIAFHAWVQEQCGRQLASVQDAARAAGMTIGIVHDLAVGADPGGADAWMLQDALALGTRIGAPPDPFNQRGQDWGMPPWRPDRLAALGYAPFRDMLRAVLAHAGGVRIDHILGMFRLWWIPDGFSAGGGTYVRYDDDALLGVLTLEAARAGAVVIGEDLGTVEPRVAKELTARGLLGSDVLYFARADEGTGPLLPPERWREATLASVTTHDLPTAAGFLHGDHVRVRAEHRLLTSAVAEEQAKAEAELAELLALLRAEGVLGTEATQDDTIVAMHALLARTPARLLGASLQDAVADRRQPNLPGTSDEYPNWRLPIADADGRVQLLEDIMVSPLAGRLLGALVSPRAANPPVF